MFDFTGKWVNTKNSVLELNQNGNKITGEFDSGVSDGGQVIKAPVVGWANGDRIAFCVTYELFGTTVAWVGQVKDEPGAPKIDSHFIHESDVKQSDEDEWLWASTRTGCDLFSKQ